MKRILTYLLFISFFNFCHAQKEAAIWYFGNNAGLDFNSGAPVPLTDGVLVTDEGCAVISDTFGNLLFYTDGLSVWNRNHQLMPNGTGLLGDPSSSQSAIVIPQPGSSSIFYVFTVDKEGRANGLNYSIVDLTLNGGLGDIAIKNVTPYRINSKNPDVENLLTAKQQQEIDGYISYTRNAQEITKTQDEIDSKLRDFYTDYNPLDVSILDREDYQSYYTKLSAEEKEVLAANKNYYEVTFTNSGGLVMPIIIQVNYADGTDEVIRIPAEIWKLNDREVSKVFVTDRQVTSMELDPFLETADTDRENNFFPPRQQLNRFEMFQERDIQGENPMQRDRRAKEKSNETN